LIQVIDDGHGMSEEDAVLAFERHATSKIETLDDLERIGTFGFRGEALPSIASVSKVELKTRRIENDVATVLTMEGGNLLEQTRDQGEIGTSVTVKNLFFNTPARRQFLKSDATEFRHIADTILRYVLSYPHIRFTFISNNETIHDAVPGNLRARMTYVFGDRLADSMIEVSEETDVITIQGYTGRPDFAKRTRGDQFLFVNGRFIFNRLLNHAIFSAYDQMVDAGSFPAYVIFLNMNPQEVDVNVHPSKLEVKFGNERNIYIILNAVVRRSLYSFDLSPSFSFRDTDKNLDFDRTRLTGPEEDSQPTQSRYDSFHSLQRGMDIEQPAPGARMDTQQIDDLFRSIGITRPLESTGGEEVTKEENGETILFPSEKPFSESQFLWQLHNKYIFTPIKSGLMIVDQHVAHERILYEKALAALDHAAPFSQQLLFPHTFRVSAGDFSVLKDIYGELEHLGFVITLSLPNFVQVEAVPQDVHVGKEESILEEMLEQFKEYHAAGLTDTRHTIAASYGCRAAIKAGDKLSAPEMQTLIDHLFATSNPYVCPHGRPIVIRLSLDDIDRRFGRT